MEIHVPASKCGLVIGKGTQLIYIIYKDSVRRHNIILKEEFVALLARV